MNRRRTLSILAGATAASLIGCGPRRSGLESRWKGILFNAEVDLVIHDLPPLEAERLIERTVSEMHRLEQMFSLYVPESDLCCLNRTGRMENPRAEFVSLVQAALEVAERSEGAFDPTVQPYWLWLREAVESGGAIDESERRRHLELVDYRGLACSSDEIRFEKTGMGMTLNGIAQGWITDRACDLLREAGAEHCLVNFGEFYGLGTQSSGEDWLVGIRGMPEEGISLRERALAVSSGAGHYFGTGAGKNHLINPRSGACSEDRRVVAVTAAKAWTADALSTACAVLGDEAAKALVDGWDDADLRILRG